MVLDVDGLFFLLTRTIFCCNRPAPIPNKRSSYHDFTINYSICGVSFSKIGGLTLEFTPHWVNKHSRNTINVFPMDSGAGWTWTCVGTVQVTARFGANGATVV